jgi:hypothetical protein
MRENIVAKLRAAHANPAARQKKASVTKAHWADPLMREKIIAAMRNSPKRRKNREGAAGRRGVKGLSNRPLAALSPDRRCAEACLELTASRRSSEQ